MSNKGSYDLSNNGMGVPIMRTEPSAELLKKLEKEGMEKFASAKQADTGSAINTISGILQAGFDEFKEKNRMFYDIIMAGEIDMPIFNYMMKMKRKLEAGEDSYGVDVKFGKYMADKYVDPLVKSIPKK